MKTLLVTLCLVTMAVCDTPFKDCGSSQGTITALHVVDGAECTSFPCVLKKGTNATINQSFTAKSDIAKATTKVYGVIGPVKVPFPMPDSDACHFMKCPIKAGQTGTYKQALEVKKEYPSTNVIVQWELHSDSGMITCFQVPASVQS